MITTAVILHVPAILSKINGEKSVLYFILKTKHMTSFMLKTTISKCNIFLFIIYLEINMEI
jgi:hypothetical protein